MCACSFGELEVVITLLKYALGLHWTEVSSTRVQKSVLLQNPQLAQPLQEKNQFTQAEFKQFAVSNLRCVCVALFY